MGIVIDLKSWIDEQDKKPQSLVFRFVRLKHARRAYNFQEAVRTEHKRYSALDSIRRSMKKGDSDATGGSSQ